MTSTRQRALVLGIILLGLLLVGFFGLRFFRAYRDFRGHRPPPLSAQDLPPAETDVDLIRDWMTIPYISVTYRLPPRLLFEVLNIEPHGNEDKSLKQLNEEYFPVAPGIVLEQVKAAIRANQPAPTAPAADTPVPPLTPVPASP